MISSNKKPQRLKPTTLQCIAIFADRRKRPAVNFFECGSSGFGDRMRGIAYALFLARKHRTDTINYAQVENSPDNVKKSAFPFRMTDLITIDGIRFGTFRLPVDLNAVSYIHYAQAGNPLKRYGFAELRRVRPKPESVSVRLDEIGRAGPYLSIHTRRTDAAGRALETPDSEENAFAALRKQSERSGIRRIYVAADNARSYEDWAGKLRREGYDVIENGAVFDSSRVRQTGADDMLVDFFALARSNAIVREVPSEFSRFASWVGGKRLRYADLR